MTTASSSPIRCAVVGVGWAGTRLVRAAGELGDVFEVICLVDPDAEHRELVASEYGVERTVSTIEEALLGDVEAVFICSPHAEHTRQTLLAIEAGRHVLVEKPMALSLADADAMVAAANDAGVVLGVAENEVYEPWVDRLREMVHGEGPIGEVAFAVVTAGHRAPDGRYPGRRAWLTEPTAGGTGSWILHGIHTVAVCRRVFGEIAEAYAREHRTASYERPDLEATMSVLLTGRGGTPLHLVQTPEVDLGEERRSIAIYGDRGWLDANRLGWRLYHAGRRPFVPDEETFPEGDRSSYAAELAAFAAAIRHGIEMPTSGRSERESLAVVLAATESVRRNVPVSVQR